MGNLHLSIRYRPVRIGLCVRQGNWDDLKNLLAISHTLWGGRFNPLIPIEDIDIAKKLIEAFQVDCLLAPNKDEAFKTFGEAFPYLDWPNFDSGLFREISPGKKACEFLDVYHPIRHLYEDHVKNVAHPKIKPTYFEWDQSDTLTNIFLATFGAYPSKNELGIDYKEVFSHLKHETIPIPPDGAVILNQWDLLTPSVVSSYDLNGRCRSLPGIYYGAASDFMDVLNFWNIRAEGADVVFYDPTHNTRLSPLVDSFLGALRKQVSPESTRPNIASYIAQHRLKNDASRFPKDFDFGCDVSRMVYKLPLRSNDEIEPMHFREQSLVVPIDQTGTKPSITFQLPPKPFFDDVSTTLHFQKFITSLQLFGGMSTGEWTFHMPYIPELNEYYGRQSNIGFDRVRVEPRGIGVFQTISDSDLTLEGLSVRDLISRIFKLFGFQAKPSQAGLIASRLIKQMGDLQKCRVFKIRGVRRLIEAYAPFQSFTRSTAITTIGDIDPVTHQLNFSTYENLYLQPRQSPKLTPEAAFIWLLEHGVFRAGLKLKCPNCDLDFWRSLDDLATEVTCEYCGARFNLTPQLKDRDWAYRRSGLFGRNDHQEGGIPVAVTLQQLDTTLKQLPPWSWSLYTTAHIFSRNNALVETDFVWLTQNHTGRIQLVIGECKANAMVTDQDLQKDIDNLTAIAQAFSGTRIDVYILFSKTSDFTPSELNLFRTSMRNRSHGLILFSRRELEPYYIYEWFEKERGQRLYVSTLDQLVSATESIYLSKDQLADAN